MYTPIALALLVTHAAGLSLPLRLGSTGLSTGTFPKPSSAYATRTSLAGPPPPPGASRPFPGSIAASRPFPGSIAASDGQQPIWKSYEPTATTPAAPPAAPADARPAITNWNPIGPPKHTTTADTDTNTAPSEVWALAIPALGSVLVEPLMRVVDTSVVGQTSQLALASLAPCSVVFQTVFCSLTFLTAVTMQLVAASPLRTTDGSVLSDAEFSKRRKEASRAVGLAQTVALGAGGAAWAALALAPASLLRLAGARPEMMPGALKYMGLCAPAVPAVLLGLVYAGACLGQQDAKTPMQIFAAAGAVNLVLDLWMALPLGGLGLGLKVGGVAAATAISQIGAAVAFAAVLRKRAAKDPSAVPLPAPLLRPSRDELSRFASIGGALALRAVVLTASYSAMSRFAAMGSLVELAAHQSAMQCWWLLSFFSEPLSQTVQSLVARDLGEGAPRRAGNTLRKCVRASLVSSVAAAALTGVMFCSPAGKVLCADAAVRAGMKTVAPLAMLAQVTCSASVVLDGAAVGCKKSGRLPALLGTATAGCLGALVAAQKLNLGLPGVWGALNVFFGLRLVGHALVSRDIGRLAAGDVRDFDRPAAAPKLVDYDAWFSATSPPVEGTPLLVEDIMQGFPDLPYNMPYNQSFPATAYSI